MRPEELQDVHIQDRLRRALAIKLGQAVIDAVDGGLSPEQAMKAVEEIWQAEQRCEHTRQMFALTYG